MTSTDSGLRSHLTRLAEMRAVVRSTGYETPKEFAAAQAADFYTAEREARDSNAVSCPSRAPIPAQPRDGAAESCRILT